MPIKNIVDDVCYICGQPIGVRQKAIFLSEVVTKPVGSNPTNGKLGIPVTNLKGFKKVAHTRCITMSRSVAVPRQPIPDIRNVRTVDLATIPRKLRNLKLQIDYPRGVTSVHNFILASYTEGYQYFAGHLMAKQKIGVIKMLRNYTGMGLKDSKDTAEKNWDKWTRLVSERM